MKGQECLDVLVEWENNHLSGISFAELAVIFRHFKGSHICIDVAGSDVARLGRWLDGLIRRFDAGLDQIEVECDCPKALRGWQREFEIESEEAGLSFSQILHLIRENAQHQLENDDQWFLDVALERE